MEKKTIGAFLSALRKANGMTQQEVADKLNVSNKTVSKWERDEGCPEIMMLPAISELYSVTVDEILRGERITKQTQEENSKSKERISSLIKIASVKYTNSLIVSIILGIISVVLAYTVSYIIYNNNVLWACYVIILAFCSASIAIALIALNNIVSSLKNEDFIEKEVFEQTMKKCVNYFSVTSLLAVTAVIGLILDVVSIGTDFLIVMLPAGVIVGAAAAYFIHSHLLKKYDISYNELSDEQKIYRRKHIKTTSVILCFVLIVSLLSPFAVAELNYLCSEHYYCFSEAMGYQYSSIEEAENEYYKLKNHITEGKPLYNVLEDSYSEESDVYYLCLEEIASSYEETDKGYNLIMTGYSNSEDFYFDSYEEAENFKAGNVLSDEFLNINSIQKNITFDDESLTVNYKMNNNYLNAVFDILPIFIIIGSCAGILVILISVIIYYKKLKSKH